VTDEERARDWGRDRRARRHDLTPEEAAEQTDLRKSKVGGFKDRRIHITISPEAHEAGKAKARALNYGAGMSLSQYIEMLIMRDTKYGERAREARREYALEHREGDGNRS